MMMVSDTLATSAALIRAHRAIASQRAGGRRRPRTDAAGQSGVPPADLLECLAASLRAMAMLMRRPPCP